MGCDPEGLLAMEYGIAINESVQRALVLHKEEVKLNVKRK